MTSSCYYAFRSSLRRSAPSREGCVFIVVETGGLHRYLHHHFHSFLIATLFR